MLGAQRKYRVSQAHVDCCAIVQANGCRPKEKTLCRSHLRRSKDGPDGACSTYNVQVIALDRKSRSKIVDELVNDSLSFEKLLVLVENVPELGQFDRGALVHELDRPLGEDGARDKGVMRQLENEQHSSWARGATNKKNAPVARRCLAPYQTFDSPQAPCPGSGAAGCDHVPHSVPGFCGRQSAG